MAKGLKDLITFYSAELETTISEFQINTLEQLAKIPPAQWTFYESYPKYTKEEFEQIKQTYAMRVNALYDLKSVTTEQLIKLTELVIQRMEEVGWIKGTLHSDFGSCLLGHAEVSATENEEWREKRLFNIVAARWQSELATFLGMAVPQYNDHSTTTKEDVTKKLWDFLYELKGR